MKFKILILDDEKVVRNSLRRVLENDEIAVLTAADPDQAWELIAGESPDLILVDYRLEGKSGLSFLQEIKERQVEVQTIMITAFGNIEVAVAAMKAGAFDFIQKNAEPDVIRFSVKRALDNLRLKKEVDELRRLCREDLNLPQFISFSPVMQQILEIAREYARTDSTVLISGETGTGKNLLARYIYMNSPRFNQPYLAINCAALPRELIESELFGYEKGAFTGAQQGGKRGLLEQANGGTLFLDEIGDLPLDLQSKLLHVLENNEYFRLGAVEPTRVDVRFIAASNSDLQALAAQKKFRMDLFYRLNVAQIHLPPLRERVEDILPLAKYFIDEFNLKFNKNVSQISPEVRHFLENGQWRGNVRELRNMIERAMLLIKEPTLQMRHFVLPNRAGAPAPPTPENGHLQVQVAPGPDKNLLQEAQKRLIEQALKLAGNNRTRAARILGIPRTSLNFYLKKYQLQDPS